MKYIKIESHDHLDILDYIRVKRVLEIRCLRCGKLLSVISHYDEKKMIESVAVFLEKVRKEKWVVGRYSALFSCGDKDTICGDCVDKASPSTGSIEEITEARDD